MITDALRSRARYLNRRLQDPALGSDDRAHYERRLRTTDAELSEARAKEAAAWTDISAEDKAAAANQAAARYKDRH